MLREWAGTALLWILGQEQECELECSPEGAAEPEEIFQDNGGDLSLGEIRGDETQA